jgi:hypothetical protein
MIDMHYNSNYTDSKRRKLRQYDSINEVIIHPFVEKSKEALWGNLVSSWNLGSGLPLMPSYATWYMTATKYGTCFTSFHLPYLLTSWLYGPPSTLGPLRSVICLLASISLIANHSLRLQSVSIGSFSLFFCLLLVFRTFLATLETFWLYASTTRSYFF